MKTAQKVNNVIQGFATTPVSNINAASWLIVKLFKELPLVFVFLLLMEILFINAFPLKTLPLLVMQPRKLQSKAMLIAQMCNQLFQQQLKMF